MAVSIRKLNKKLILVSLVGFIMVMVISNTSRTKRSTPELSLHNTSQPIHFNISDTVSKTSSPKTNIVFLKIHKAASSTVQNIFLRFALSHRLNVFLTKDPTELHINENNDVLNKNNAIPLPFGVRFNILTHHLVFNKNQISRFFPADTVYIGIVREPYSRFVSSLYYYGTYWNVSGLKECVENNDDPVFTFLENPNKYEPLRRLGWSQVNNRMSRDFGMKLGQIIKSKNNKTVTKNFIKKIDSQVDLVLVMEHFDSSMVMMKRFLNWTFKDILYMKINQLTAFTTVKQKTISNSKINKMMYSKYAPSEFALYDHFHSKFLDKVKALGRDFEEEVEAFKSVRAVVGKFCDHRASNRTILRVDGTRWSRPFRISYHSCELMKTDEIKLTDTVRIVQNDRLSNYVRTAPG